MRLNKLKRQWGRATTYEIYRKIPEMTRVSPAKGSQIVPIGEGSLDLAEALDGLFAWLSAHEKAALAVASQGKSATRRQRAEKELGEWFNQFGGLEAPRGLPDFWGYQINEFGQKVPLDAPWSEDIYQEGHDAWPYPYLAETVEDIVHAARTLRTLVQGILGHPMGSFGEQALNTVSEGAAELKRNPKTFEWEAPSLWSLLCRAVLHHEDLDWGFDICAASDCSTPFVVRRANRAFCSKRCSKRGWAQRHAGKR